MRYEMTVLRRYTALDKVESRFLERFCRGTDKDLRAAWNDICDDIAGVPGHDEDKPLATWLKDQWLGKE